ncbi:hypothetical protein J3R82DRAFT_10224 [Butyriboletus roseoflavus]|nr:hypothetical protein J3R82DRAFT_10224 [Butyriboletus roseoflavus]
MTPYLVRPSFLPPVRQLLIKLLTARRPPQTTPEVAAHAPTVSPYSPKSVPSMGLCTPRPSPLHSTSTFAPQHTPVKRKHSECSATDPRFVQTNTTPELATDNTPSKKARLQAIEAGLRARREDETPHQPPRPEPAVPEHLDALPFTHGVEPNEPASAPSPASDTTTEVEEDVEPPRARYSFLGLPPTQESQSGAEPSTPKKRPSSVLQDPETAPRHLPQPRAAVVVSRPEPVSPTRYKGKERASAQWDRLVEAEENPFVDTTSLFKFKLETDAVQRASSRSPRSSVGSQGPSCIPTTGERIASNINGMRDTIHTLMTYANTIDQLDAGKFIERLERQKNALGYGDEVKKQHIAALSAECDELKAKLLQCVLFAIAPPHPLLPMFRVSLRAPPRRTFGPRDGELTSPRMRYLGQKNVAVPRTDLLLLSKHNVDPDHVSRLVRSPQHVLLGPFDASFWGLVAFIAMNLLLSVYIIVLRML